MKYSINFRRKSFILDLIYYITHTKNMKNEMISK